MAKQNDQKRNEIIGFMTMLHTGTLTNEECKALGDKEFREKKLRHALLAYQKINDMDGVANVFSAAHSSFEDDVVVEAMQDEKFIEYMRKSGSRSAFVKSIIDFGRQTYDKTRKMGQFDHVTKGSTVITKINTDSKPKSETLETALQPLDKVDLAYHTAHRIAETPAEHSIAMDALNELIQAYENPTHKNESPQLRRAYELLVKVNDIERALGIYKNHEKEFRNGIGEEIREKNNQDLADALGATCTPGPNVKKISYDSCTGSFLGEVDQFGNVDGKPWVRHGTASMVTLTNYVNSLKNETGLEWKLGIVPSRISGEKGKILVLRADYADDAFLSRYGDNVINDGIANYNNSAGSS